jgi:hypothetical protein
MIVQRMPRVRRALGVASLNGALLLCAWLLCGCSGSAPTSGADNGGTSASATGGGGPGNTGGGPGNTGGDTAAPGATGGRTAITGGSGGTPAAGGSGTENPTWEERERVRLLLSGHSLTDNPLGFYLWRMTEARDHDYDWEQHIVVGSPIRVRTRGMDSEASTYEGYSLGLNKDGFGKSILEELRSPTAIPSSDRYDTLVIAERADLPVAIVGEDTIPYLRHYHDRVREQESRARTFLFQTWPDIDKANPQRWLDYVEDELTIWECAVAKVNLTLERDGLPPAVSVLPTGMALRRFVRAALDGEVPGITGSPRERLDAIFGDNIHLTWSGAYVMASAVYSAAFGSSPVGTPAPEDPQAVDPGIAAAGAQIAWDVVSEYLGRSQKPWARTMEECRSAMAAICPDFLAIHNTRWDCASFSDPNGAFKWPDPSIPLPPP